MRTYRQFASVYDRLMEEMPYSEWMLYARTCWERYGMPKTIVDLGCGTGNMAIPLAKAGFAVFGIDLSAEMLSIARSKWDEQEAGSGQGARSRGGAGSIRWLQQDMRDWELPEPVDAVICFCDCMNYLTEPDGVTAAIRSTFDGLAPGGLFLFDVHAPITFERYADEQPFVLDDKDVAYLWTCDYDPDTRTIDHDLTFFVRDVDAGGAEAAYRRFEESHSQRAYDPDWISQQLLDAGFELLHRTADFAWDEPTAQSERIFFAARKPRG